jgi:1,2-diacylglycerol 3-alpha-glucosyltransferase
MTRIAVIFRRLGPYHHARLAAASCLAEVMAIELGGADEYAWSTVHPPQDLNVRTLFTGADGAIQPPADMRRRMDEALDSIRPDVVAIPGWWGAGAWSGLGWCVRHGRPAVVMSASTRDDAPRHSVIESIKARLVRLCAAGLVGGAPHAAYLQELGMPSSRIFTGYDAVDNAYFQRESTSARARAAVLRDRLGLPERYWFASCRFVEKKNLARLLEAWAWYTRRAGDDAWKLVLAGDGPLRGDLLAARQELKLEDQVIMPGFVQYDQLPIYYGLASAFVHASTTEQWGLVVNEAMASGLAVLVSRRCGCSRDLVHEGVNGHSFDPYDVGQLGWLILKMSSGSMSLDRFGREGRRIVRQWGPERFAQSLRQAAQAAIAAPGRRAGVIDRTLLEMLMQRVAA